MYYHHHHIMQLNPPENGCYFYVIRSSNKGGKPTVYQCEKFDDAEKWIDEQNEKAGIRAS